MSRTCPFAEWRPAVRSITSLAVALLAVSPLFAGPVREVLFVSQSQSGKQSPPPGKTQKLANPLNELLDEAQHDIDTNNFESAIAPLQKFIAQEPNVAYGHFQLAYTFTALKRSDEARQEYERAIALDSKMAEAYLNLGVLLLDKQPADAIAPLRKAVDLLASQSRPRFLLGIAYERSGKLSDARESFEAASRLDPHDAEILAHLADMNSQTNQPQKAEEQFRAMLVVGPTSGPALLGLARALDAQHKPEALDAYRAYLKVHPGAPGAQRRVIRLLIEQEKYDDAIAEMDREEPGIRNSVDSLRSRADVYIAAKKYDGAIAALRQALQLAANDAQLHGGLGELLLQRRDFPGAEKELRASLAIDGKNLRYWKDLSSTYYLAGNYPATLSTLDLIAKAEQPAAGTWFIRALCYDKLRQLQPALDAYQKFLALDDGKNADQIWQAQQRSKVLKRELEQKR
ncbi:MAG TPA: tetratricopeptide repeat protein [Candidatus Acidoferrum sp.]|jgi:superkiller protein 3